MQSIKLVVTMGANLAKKYNPAARAAIAQAVLNWKNSDAQRGITLVHIALDSTADMGAQGLTRLAPTASAALVKRKIDALWKKLEPDYLVLLGGADVVPMFEVPNPSYQPSSDDDTVVPTDNPYACSKAYVASDIQSYLVPDRVVGRIPDMPDDGDHQWLCAYLATVTQHQPRPAEDYAQLYAVGCAQWLAACQDLVQYLGHPQSDLLVSPPVIYTDAATAQGLGKRLHAFKCHGGQLDSKFYGQSGIKFEDAFTSALLRPLTLDDTLPASGCCWGAQVFNPNDPAAQHPGEWPVSSTYLRQGAVGFMGSTMIAWVGQTSMLCADWIVGHYLKTACAGASLGRALLESKLYYLNWLAGQGQSPDVADQKTLLEFVLLGDPALHPVQLAAAPAAVPATASMQAATAAAASVSRLRRRLYSANLATTIRSTLPEREQVSNQASQTVRQAAMSALGDDANLFDMAPLPAAVKVSGAAAPSQGDNQPVTASMRRSLRQDASYEYYWGGRVEHGHLRRIRLVKVEADAQGRPLRTTVYHAASAVATEGSRDGAHSGNTARRSTGRNRAGWDRQ